jgi:polysaccharide export outer membrane protein
MELSKQLMKKTRGRADRGLTFLSILGAALLITSCKAPDFQPLPVGVPNPMESMGQSDIFSIGDQVLVNFSGSSGMEPPLQPHKEAIKEDGTITPPLVGPVKAAGRTPGDLQNELTEKYKKLYNNMNVTVLPADRFYYVAGEVRRPGPVPYLGKTDIIKAISAAGDFTDFANKKKVRITRADGRTEVVNVQRAIDHPEYDVAVYPGDKIMVKRSIF